MQTLALVVLVAIVLGQLARIVTRRNPRLADPVAVASLLVLYVGVAGLLGWSAVLLAQDDEALRLAVAGFLGLVAIGQVLMAALVAWGFLISRREDHE